MSVLYNDLPNVGLSVGTPAVCSRIRVSDRTDNPDSISLLSPHLLDKFQKNALKYVIVAFFRIL